MTSYTYGLESNQFLKFWGLLTMKITTGELQADQAKKVIQNLIIFLWLCEGWMSNDVLNFREKRKRPSCWKCQGRGLGFGDCLLRKAVPTWNPLRLKLLSLGKCVSFCVLSCMRKPLLTLDLGWSSRHRSSVLFVVFSSSFPSDTMAK